MDEFRCTSAPSAAPRRQRRHGGGTLLVAAAAAAGAAGCVAAAFAATGSAPTPLVAQGLPALQAVEAMQLRGGAAAEASATSALSVAYSGFAVGAGAALAALALQATARAAGRRRPGGRSAAAAAPVGTQLPTVDRSTTKNFRKDLQRSEQYFKFGKTQMEEAMGHLKGISGSDLLDQIRKNGFRMTFGDVTFVLAESYGFCWGVERAVAMSYEARNFFPDKKIWGTNEIIHNPVVNRNLNNLGIKFIEVSPDGKKDFSVVGEGDVVLLPAFGASVDEMAYLQKKGVQIVDTTCPWVSKVWNSVEKSKDKGHTSIIHGKYEHEETIATKSFADKYIVVKTMEEAEYVAQYILGFGNKAEFMKKFAKAMSPGFDPDVDLAKVGVANQTTMLKGETELIGKLFERVMIKKYGPQDINKHFLSFNTICDATQERQDAMYKMFDTEYEAPTSKLYTNLEGEQVGVALQSDKKPQLSSRKMEDATRGEAASPSTPAGRPDMVLVVGGFNSSNTTHLVEIPLEEGCPAYHVDSPERIGGHEEVPRNTIQHKPLTTTPAQAMREEGLVTLDNFLSKGPVVVGVTSGASTPDNITGECLKRILEIKSRMG